MKNISDEQFRAYFLGKLPEQEAEILEMECAADAPLTERAQTVENDLTDDYLRKNLSASDAALFESNYLTTETRRNKLRVANGLWQIAREEKPKSAAAAATTSAKSFGQKLFGGQKALKFAFGGLILLFVVCAVVFFFWSFIGHQKNGWGRKTGKKTNKKQNQRLHQNGSKHYER